MSIANLLTVESWGSNPDTLDVRPLGVGCDLINEFEQHSFLTAVIVGPLKYRICHRCQTVRIEEIGNKGYVKGL